MKIKNKAHKKTRQTYDIISYVIQHGGINYNREHLKGEIRHAVESQPKLRFAVNKQGRGFTLDDWAMRAVEAGFPLEEQTPQGFLDALYENLKHPEYYESDAFWKKQYKEWERKYGRN